ncbi:hypothetical protein E5288_WYG009340 [Bos mutus]|uniref:Uncharacterized protein n=1 Tax=Bos mutus TaxID=72004 RepID=A0A6B0S159_9CETA|nr:hypothetical protein [Bos mutus]
MSVLSPCVDGAEVQRLQEGPPGFGEEGGPALLVIKNKAVPFTPSSKTLGAHLDLPGPGPLEPAALAAQCRHEALSEDRAGRGHLDQRRREQKMQGLLLEGPVSKSTSIRQSRTSSPPDCLRAAGSINMPIKGSAL